MEPRKDFFANELDLERMNNVLNDVIDTLTLKEILKMVREISYDMVCYYDKYNKGIIYCDNKYSELNQEQACRLQRLLSAACDLFGQSIINHREFDEGYLNHWLNGGTMELQIAELKNTIEHLEKKVEILEDEKYDLINQISNNMNGEWK